MKTLFLIITCGIYLSSACNHPKETSTMSPSFNGDSVAAAQPDTTSKKSEHPSTSSKTKGRVSHQYATNGCSTILLVKKENEEPLILIPRAPLSKEFDIEGQDIFFNYHLLKMRTPPGCEKGIPAEITDVSLK